MANNGVNVKMGVSGVSQFKQDMNVAKNAVKTLDEQLKLNEKQFRATGNAEEYLEKKAQLLKAKLDEQNAMVASAEKALKSMQKNGIDPSNASFQTMQQRLLQAKGAVLDTQQELDSLGKSAKTADTDTQDLNKDLENIGKNVSVRNVIDGIDSITGSLENAAKHAVDLGKKLFSTMTGAGEYADEINSTAQKWGISPDDLQRMRKTEAIIDTSAEAILSARQKMQKTLSGDKGKETLEDVLGITLNGQSPEDLFWEIGDALMNMDDAFDKEAAATQLFGRSWRELVPLFSAGREQYEDMNASWDVLSQEQLDSLNAMDDKFAKLQADFETLKMTALAEFAEPMREIMKTLNELMHEFSEWLKSDEGQAVMDSVVTKVTETLQWLVENKDGVIRALEAIAIGWGAIKLTGGALRIWELVTGLKGLLGGGGGATAAGAADKGLIGAAKGGLGSLAGGASMMGGAATILPIAALAAGGFAGWKMIEANMNDESLNQVYGDSEGMDLLDRMTQEQLLLAKEYEKLYQSGTEEAMALREELLASLENSGIEHGELGVELLENIFDERLRENDVDGLVEKFDRLASVAEEMYDTDGAQRQATSELSAAAGEIRGLGGIVEAAILDGMSQIRIYIDGESVGRAVSPHVGGIMGSQLKALVK